MFHFKSWGKEILVRRKASLSKSASCICKLSVNFLVKSCCVATDVKDCETLGFCGGSSLFHWHWSFFHFINSILSKAPKQESR